jgi:hypothetical protein
MMTMMFASTLRSLHMLSATKNSFSGVGAARFSQDLQAIVAASPEDFEAVFALERTGGGKSLIEVYQSIKSDDRHRRVATVMKHLLVQNAVVPLTDGNKMKMRHVGFSTTLNWGPVKVFMTNNFADTYSPIVAKLAGWAANLLQDTPEMPTAQRMHEIIAKHPTFKEIVSPR